MKPLSAKVITPATDRLFSLATLYSQVEQVEIDTDGHPDDALLLGILDAATDYAEKFTGRSLLLRTWEFALDEFPTSFGTTTTPADLQILRIEVPNPPLVEIVSFMIGEESDDELLEEGVDYLVDDYGDKAVLRPVSTWPTVFTAYPNLIKVRYRAGYQSEEEPDSDATALPGGLRAAVLLMVGHLYDHREASVEKAMQELPLGVEALLRPYRVLTGMA